MAIHLTTGLRYVKDKHPNNAKKLSDKFSKDIEYAQKYFTDYAKHFMLWTPIVKYAGKEAKHNQIKDVEQIQKYIQDRYDIEIELIINEKFAACLQELREFARKETKELKSAVLRYMQVEAYLEKYLHNITKKNRRKGGIG